MLRLVVAPAREEELFDPIVLHSPEFQRKVLEIGHRADVELFSYLKAKKPSLDAQAFTIRQESQWNRSEPMLYVRLRIEESGAVTIDGNLTGRTIRNGDGDPFAGMTVLTSDIESLVVQFLHFVTALHAEYDPYGRFEQLRYDVAVRLQAYGSIEKKIDGSNSRTMNINADPRVSLIAHNTPRSILRNASAAVLSEAQRTALRLHDAAQRPYGD
ncbi:MAG: hypothetical protein ABI852_03945 [Gemmatimonadaceae bacterium]